MSCGCNYGCYNRGYGYGYGGYGYGGYGGYGYGGPGWLYLAYLAYDYDDRHRRRVVSSKNKRRRK